MSVYKIYLLLSVTVVWPLLCKIQNMLNVYRLNFAWVFLNHLRSRIRVIDLFFEHSASSLNPLQACHIHFSENYFHACLITVRDRLSYDIQTHFSHFAVPTFILNSVNYLLYLKIYYLKTTNNEMMAQLSTKKLIPESGARKFSECWSKYISHFQGSFSEN
jgi:hypothetical protein